MYHDARQKLDCRTFKFVEAAKTVVAWPDCYAALLTYHKYDYKFTYCSRVDSQMKCKFCTNTESCMEYEEWEPTTVT